ncbi:uncharacterized protein LOC105832436 [Monomorium pharaonis]|uniref:uncharacterized protein LOC105832436 n=1 Tax=Monomorium pharaonis TaxID=307658 RepID=UPI00102E17AD|nr:uncharacterized protein LOC105832436 [Monomorium pharaonis]
MAARTGAGGGETPATVLDDNAGIVTTTAGPLAESSTSSSSTTTSSCSSSVTAVAGAAVPTVILTESTATSAGSLPLTGSQQQSNLHQVHQPQQPSRQRINLITDVAVNDVAGRKLSLFFFPSSSRRYLQATPELTPVQSSVSPSILYTISYLVMEFASLFGGVHNSTVLLLIEWISSATAASCSSIFRLFAYQ